MSQALAVQVSGRITKDHIEGILLAQPAADAVLAGLQFGTMSKSILFFAQKYFDSHTPDLPPAGVYARLLAEFERPVIEVALAATSGNQAKCADLLGINRNTLRKKIKELGLNVTRGRRMM
jgi:two-component system nitrogen regulation response regulator GlnG